MSGVAPPIKGGSAGPARRGPDGARLMRPPGWPHLPLAYGWRDGIVPAPSRIGPAAALGVSGGAKPDGASDARCVPRFYAMRVRCWNAYRNAPSGRILRRMLQRKGAAGGLAGIWKARGHLLVAMPHAPGMPGQHARKCTQEWRWRRVPERLEGRPCALAPDQALLRHPLRHILAGPLPDASHTMGGQYHLRMLWRSGGRKEG